MASVRSRPTAVSGRRSGSGGRPCIAAAAIVCARVETLSIRLVRSRTPLFYTRTCLLLLLLGRKRPPSPLGRALLLLHRRLTLLQLDIALVAHALMIAAPRPAGPLLVLGRRDRRPPESPRGAEGGGGEQRGDSKDEGDAAPPVGAAVGGAGDGDAGIAETAAGVGGGARGVGDGDGLGGCSAARTAAAGSKATAGAAAAATAAARRSRCRPGRVQPPLWAMRLWHSSHSR